MVLSFSPYLLIFNIYIYICVYYMYINPKLTLIFYYKYMNNFDYIIFLSCDGNLFFFKNVHFFLFFSAIGPFSVCNFIQLLLICDIFIYLCIFSRIFIYFPYFHIFSIFSYFHRVFCIFKIYICMYVLL